MARPFPSITIVVYDDFCQYTSLDHGMAVVKWRGADRYALLSLRGEWAADARRTDASWFERPWASLVRDVQSYMKEDASEQRLWSRGPVLYQLWRHYVSKNLEPTDDATILTNLDSIADKDGLRMYFN